MEFLTLHALAFYMIIAALSLYMTLQERRRTGSDGVAYTIGGYLLCLIWPATILAILISPRLRST